MEKCTVPQAVFDAPEAFRIAKLGHAQAYRELENKPRHMLDEGDPNHPMYDLHIFGELQETFLQRQYK